MKRIPLNAGTFGDKEINAAIGVVKSTHVTMGKKCREFERVFAEYVEADKAIFVNSGSSANLLVFFAPANYAAPQTPVGNPDNLRACHHVIRLTQGFGFILSDLG